MSSGCGACENFFDVGTELQNRFVCWEANSQFEKKVFPEYPKNESRGKGAMILKESS